MKTAFITGAGSGIGRSLAHTLADKGCAVYITDINAENLGKVEDELKAKQVNVHARVLDVSNKGDVFDAVRDAETKIGPIEGMFNNAGISFSDLVVSHEYDDFEKIMDVDFWGVVHGTKAVLPGMIERGKGHIVNISSIFGIIGVPSQAAYCSAKHAVKGFNESLFYELKDTGVQVHSVHPGGVDTGIVKHGVHKNSLDGEVNQKEMEERFKDNVRTSPDEAAAIILKGVSENRYRILVGPDAKLMDRLQRWLPNGWRKIFPRLMDGLFDGKNAEAK